MTAVDLDSRVTTLHWLAVRSSVWWRRKQRSAAAAAAARGDTRCAPSVVELSCKSISAKTRRFRRLAKLVVAGIASRRAVYTRWDAAVVSVGGRNYIKPRRICRSASVCKIRLHCIVKPVVPRFDFRRDEPRLVCMHAAWYVGQLFALAKRKRSACVVFRCSSSASLWSSKQGK